LIGRKTIEGIDRVPYHLGNSKDRLAYLSNPMKVIVLNLNLKRFGAHGASLNNALADSEPPRQVCLCRRTVGKSLFARRMGAGSLGV
jgi:hypothetical protein